MSPTQPIIKTLRVILCLLGFSSLGHAVVTLTGSNTGWTSVGANYDYVADQQTGQGQADINGNASNPGFLTRFDNAGTGSLTDGFLAFRVRFAERDGQVNSPAFSAYAWVGVDANNDGGIDAFIRYNGGNNAAVGVYAPGTGLNNSPSTTTISNTAYAESLISANPTYLDYRAVNYLTDGGTTNDVGADGNGDFYLSFQLQFVDLVNYLATKGISANENTAFKYIVATSTQGNSLNQDLGGVPKTYDGTQTWATLGGLSTQISANGVVVVPELHSSFLVFFGAMALLLRRRV